MQNFAYFFFTKVNAFELLPFKTCQIAISNYHYLRDAKIIIIIIIIIIITIIIIINAT